MNPEKNILVSRKNLCMTLAGNRCDYLTVTSKKPNENKKGIVITARVHPGESVGSWMMKGVIDFITDPHHKEAELLRDNFVFKIIPMLNPDGADQFRRRTALNIDLNRDALRLQTPEGQLLKKIRDDISADWGFNLHDQSRYYTVGKTDKSATISFLAPAYEENKYTNEVCKYVHPFLNLSTSQQIKLRHCVSLFGDLRTKIR